jgi:hypothetical protein
MASTSYLVPAIGDEKPLSPEEKAELEVWRNERKAEKEALEVKVREWTKELSKMPEWQEMLWWNREYHYRWKMSNRLDFESDTIADETERIASLAFEGKDEYRKTKYLPALKAHPLGPDYIAARKRLKELKWV